MGVNNHGQTIVFACGFLNHESVDDFHWLFTQFLESIPSGAPKMIITNQDPAMTKAFPIILPNTFHRYFNLRRTLKFTSTAYLKALLNITLFNYFYRYCSWHILMKFSKKIDAVKYGIYKNEFSDCIWKSETPEEFELQWESLMKKSGLGGNKWLNDMYGIRSRWISAYVNHIFSADMSSSQRAESGHAFFKKFVSKNNSLVDFMIQFGRGLIRQRHEELIVDHKDLIEKPKMRIDHDFLFQMVEIYTNEMFYKFEEELCKSFNYKFEFLRENETHRVYHIRRKRVETSKVREIIYDKNLDFVLCACKKFDSAGIPCRHVLAYLCKFYDLAKLPDKYILKRWTKSAKSGRMVDDNGVDIVNDSTHLSRRSQFIQLSLDVVDKALVYEETRKMFTDGLYSINEQIDQFIGSRTSANISIEINNLTCAGTSVLGGTSKLVGCSAHDSCNVDNSYNEPDQVRAKGCGKRLKGGKEKALARVKNKKVRRCHGCGKAGQAHDKRNCPAFTNPSSLYGDANLEDGNDSSTEDGVGIQD
ncbi:hypothetical protein LguiB_026091 [Lonicera macranthoides]